ncbi:sigma factor, partial [Chloroflexota bacterium]
MKDFRINSRQENKAQTTEAVTADQARIARLVGKAVGGDFEAFGELYSTYVVQIYRYVFYQVRNKMIAEDLTEEVFVKAWKSMSS